MRSQTAPDPPLEPHQRPPPLTPASVLRAIGKRHVILPILGDYFEINGSKIWTSDALFPDWIFCLVRTDFDAPRHEGISFLLFSLDQPGVTIKPTRLISGASPFCECSFDNAQASKEDLVGRTNRGWTIAKRLLQHERSSISGVVPQTRSVPEVAFSYDKRDDVLIGPVRSPRNSARHLGAGSIHDDATAQKLGFRGGTVAGPLHMEQFPPLLMAAPGEDWLETGGMSLYFKYTTTGNEAVQAFARR